MDIEVRQQRPRPPRVLAGDQVYFLQHAQSTGRDILEIPDGRRDDVECAGQA
jgi:hypothetical protein